MWWWFPTLVLQAAEGSGGGSAVAPPLIVPNKIAGMHRGERSPAVKTRTGLAFNAPPE